MNRTLKVLAYFVTGLAGLTVVAALAVYTISEIKLRHKYDVPLRTFSAASDPASIAEGERLARIRGCYGGCHGKGLEGEVFFNEPYVALISAPNLTRIVREYTDPELERVIRHGVRRNGRSVFAMPSPMFAELADEDLARIIGFLRSQPLVENSPPPFHTGPVGRIGLVAGMYKPLAPTITTVPAAYVPRESPVEWGRYLAHTVCTECHGRNLQGDPSGKPPNLRIAAAFSDSAWFHLMRKGRGLGDREVGLMGEVALHRFRYFTDDEARALHAYLKTFAASQASQSDSAR